MGTGGTVVTRDTLGPGVWTHPQGVTGEGCPVREDLLLLAHTVDHAGWLLHLLPFRFSPSHFLFLACFR